MPFLEAKRVIHKEAGKKTKIIFSGPISIIKVLKVLFYYPITFHHYLSVLGGLTNVVCPITWSVTWLVLHRQ